jgi:hypothetical protein
MDQRRGIAYNSDSNFSQKVSNFLKILGGINMGFKTKIEVDWSETNTKNGITN